MQKSTFRKFRAIFIAILVTAMTNYAISFATSVDLVSDEGTTQVTDARGQDSQPLPTPPKPPPNGRGQDSQPLPKPPKPTGGG